MASAQAALAYGMAVARAGAPLNAIGTAVDATVSAHGRLVPPAADRPRHRPAHPRASPMSPTFASPT